MTLAASTWRPHRTHATDVIFHLIAILFAGFPASGHYDLRVYVCGNTAVDEGTMTAAQTAVKHVFESSGVEIVWTNDPSALRVQILDGKFHDVRDGAVGYAVLSGSSSYAVVSLPAARAVAEKENAPLSTVLAVAVAHEIGHVLLGSAHHCLTGVMSATLDRKMLLNALSGSLHFASRESMDLRVAVRQRD
jgi:hypothetical protein